MSEIDLVQEKLYNVRERVPNHLDVFADWREKSANYIKMANAVLDIRYGIGDKATLDLFMPEGVTIKPPLHIFIHGGYWQALDKADQSFIAKPFVERGIAVAIVNYDLCPDVSLSYIIDQMRQMMRWAFDDGQKYGYDETQIHISGHSAGGHLVGCLLATDWVPHSNRTIKSCVAISGLYDLAPLVHTSINKAVGLTEDDAKRLSPLRQICFSKCPVLCLVGGVEGEGFIQQSKNAVDDWSRQGIKVDLSIIEDANHFDVVDILVDPTSKIFKKVMSFYSAA